MIFAHRCYIERGEDEVIYDKIKEHFGEGGNYPDPTHRWLCARTPITELTKMGIDKQASGLYYGFRTRDDQVMFYMLFEGQLRNNNAS
jgi:hypothetical protein